VKATVPEPVLGIVVLDDIIEGAVLQQVDGGAHILLAGDHDDPDVRVMLS